MAFEITGKVIDILPAIQVSDKFKKREFVIEKKEANNKTYSITEKGQAYLNQYKLIIGFTSSFGLD